MKSKEIQSKLWKILESRDRSLKQGLHRWDKQEKALVERMDEIASLKKAADEKDREIELLKGESNEKDEEIIALKSTLDVRLKILEEQHAELERIKTSFFYRVLHGIRHPENFLKKKS